MAFNRLHAQHTSWLVPLCLDGAFNEGIDFQKVFAQQQYVRVMVFECAAVKSAEKADQVKLAEVAYETVTVWCILTDECPTTTAVRLEALVLLRGFQGVASAGCCSTSGRRSRMPSVRRCRRSAR